MPKSASLTSGSLARTPLSPSDRAMITVRPCPTESWSSVATRARDTASSRWASSIFDRVLSTNSSSRARADSSLADSAIPSAMGMASVRAEASASVSSKSGAPRADPVAAAARDTAPAAATLAKEVQRPSA